MNKAPSLKLATPRVVAVSQPGEKRWGYTQFPAFSTLPDGRILLVHADAEDASETHGAPAPAHVSSDHGETWTAFKEELVPSRPHFAITPAYDGEFFTVPSFRYLNVREAGLALPEPVAEADVYGRVYTYRVDDFGPEVAHYFGNLGAWRWGPSTRQWVAETTTYATAGLLAWRRESSDLLPRTFFERPALRHRGELLYPDYRVRYALGDGHYPIKGGTTLMASRDNGRSFTNRATVAVDRTGRDLHGEPAIEETSDGGLVCVIRRSDQAQKPMVICYSTDAGHSWSTPEDFCAFGVFPYLLRLPSGILVLSYGRPGVWLRINADGNGRNWSEPVYILPGDPAAVGLHSCGYTSLSAIGSHSFLITYSDFNHRYADGTLRKAILCRRVDLEA